MNVRRRSDSLHGYIQRKNSSHWGDAPMKWIFLSSGLYMKTFCIEPKHSAQPGEWRIWKQEWSEDGSSAFFSCSSGAFYMQKPIEIPSSSSCSFIYNRQVFGSDEIYPSCLIAMWQCACVCVWKWVYVLEGGHKVFSSLLEPNITMMTGNTSWQYYGDTCDWDLKKKKRN